MQQEKEFPPMPDLARQLSGHRLTLAEILYHMPDHPGILQSFIWQALDLAPRFPALHRFLDFWSHNLDGKLHEVRIAQSSLVKPSEFRFAEVELRLH